MGPKLMPCKPAFPLQSRCLDIHSQRKSRRRLRVVHPRRIRARTAGCVLLSATLGVHQTAGHQAHGVVEKIKTVVEDSFRHTSPKIYPYDMYETGCLRIEMKLGGLSGQD